MSNTTLESIGTEKTRVTERLAKIDIERTRLETQLSEYEAAERVMARFSSNETIAKPRSTKAPAVSQKTAATPRKRGRPAKVTTTPGATPAKTARVTRASGGGIKLGAAVCDVISQYPQGATVAQISGALKSKYSLSPRPNHLGIALQRNKRGGRLQERDGTWYTPQAMAQAA